MVYGADRRTAGEVRVDGQSIKGSHIRDAIRHGLVFCPEDRKEDGIIGVRSVSENINISARRNHLTAGLFVNDRNEARTADSYIERLRIRTPHRRQEIRLLSGWQPAEGRALALAGREGPARADRRRAPPAASTSARRTRSTTCSANWRGAAWPW